MRIACLLGPGFEDSEFKVPFDAFRGAGHEVQVVGRKAGEIVDGKRGMEKVKVDLSIDQVRPDQFDALFIPGGFSPDNLRADPRFVRVVQQWGDKPLFAVCHGPQLLLSAGVVQGRTLTAWSTVQGDLRYAGANVVDREVVVDRNWVTSRKPDDLQAFVREALSLLRSERHLHA
jgi:protease I